MPNPIVNRRNILRRNGASRLPVTQYGNIVSQDFSLVSDLSSYTVVNPSSTWSIVANKLHTTTAVVGGFTEYVTYDGYGVTLLDRWTQTINFKHTFNAASIGITVGNKNANAKASDEYLAFAAMYAGGEGVLTLFKNGVSVAAEPTVMAGTSSTDSWVLSLERTFGTLPTYVATLTNSTLALTNTCTYSGITMASVVNATNTATKFRIINNGGDFDISTFVVNSTANKNVDICFLGYSIDEGYNASSYADSWTVKSMAGNAKSYTKLCSQSSYSQVLLDSMNEIIACNALTYVIGGVLGNDKVFLIADAAADANYTSIVSQIKAGVPGCTVIHIKETPRNALDMTPINTRRVTLAGADTIVDLFTGIKDGGTGINAIYDTDGTHPNAAGHAVIGTAMQPYLV